jgi:hypothetical protein
MPYDMTYIVFLLPQNTDTLACVGMNLILQSTGLLCPARRRRGLTDAPAGPVAGP